MTQLTPTEIYETALRKDSAPVMIAEATQMLCAAAQELMMFARGNPAHDVPDCIADVLITMEQLCVYFDREDVELARNFKLRSRAVRLGMAFIPDDVQITEDMR